MELARRSATMGVLFLSACAPSNDQAVALGEYLLQSLVLARQTADTVMIEEIFLPDATYDDYPGQIEYRGIADIVSYLTSVHEWGDDVYLNLGNVHTGPSVAVAEWFFAAVQERPIPDVITTRTGREVVLSGTTIIEIEGGRIARAADYSDQAALLLQLGGRIEMPDGTVIQSDEPGR
jgi:hypothetical protein